MPTSSRSLEARVIRLPLGQPGDDATSAQPPPPPNRLFTFCEPPRASMELGWLMASAPLLLAAARGDGHPVLVLPGLSGGAGWTTVMRGYLRAIGHSVHGPRFAATKGHSDRVRRLLADRVEQLADRHGKKVSIVAWSVGGCFARQVVAADPGPVRQLVTLGTPLDGMWYPEGQEHAAGRLDVPVTSVYSRTDGIFEWRRCLQPGGPRSENVEVPTSHLGMASNPFTFHVLADRLALPERGWRPYSSPLPFPGARIR
jgi:pimeloyl-ACP methyl ester carboxylesterase